ncbi:MAG: FadR family transcriptional regulator [Thermoanaerobacteraceae bacterium]|uniref:FadR/GntR family transcriptional regulator n=1 Tax=Tepidanaerobacter sp. GT38 TaxID=2722793 RepID=UPI001793DCA0|nr:FadR/GntR family transcriptional regulator [Tepidanaerobacter sp. GT38]MCG1013143.1 FadR family transcriptional regulator [Tepidanaerobacter sp. GT38]NLZ53104.1 FadR family transcriptional regulator [Thermoanaerobacteraceae bacterium]
MDFKPVKTERIFENIIQQIKHNIYNGNFSKGSKLPSERELSNILNVSRASIREAFSALEILGILETNPGGGTYIVNNVSKTTIEIMSLALALENDETEFIELRKILESESAYIAAEKQDAESIAEMKKYFEMMSVELDEEKNTCADKNFHRALCKATKNKLLCDIVEALSVGIDHYIKNARQQLMGNPRNLEFLYQQHKNILKSIEDGKPEDARRNVIEHIDFVQEELKKLKNTEQF